MAVTPGYYSNIRNMEVRWKAFEMVNTCFAVLLDVILHATVHVMVHYMTVGTGTHVLLLNV